MENTKNPTQIIVVALQKGGVGKTTVATNLAIFLANWKFSDKRVLFIDADPQGNGTSGICPNDFYMEGDKKILSKELFDVMNEYDPKNPSSLQPQNVILGTNYPNLHILPTWSNRKRLQGATAVLTSNPYIIQDIIDSVRDDYDFIIVDTAPSNGIFEKAFFKVATSIMGVVNGKRYADTGFQLLQESIVELQQRERITAKIDCVVLNHYTKNLTLDQNTYKILKELEEKMHAFKLFVLPQNQNVNNIATSNSNLFDTNTPISHEFQAMANHLIKSQETSYVG